MAKKNKVDWDKVHIELERQGKFDEYTTPFSEENLVVVDENYEYLPNRLSFRMLANMDSVIVTLFGRLVTFFAFGLKIKGKEKLKALKDTGTFSVSSHITFLDALVLKNIFNCKKKCYITVAKHNNKKGAGGDILRAAGILPLSDNLGAVKNFSDALKVITCDRHQNVHFYAERAMWLNYNKPRPMKRGAFSYAAKLGIPVLPIYYELKPAKGFFKMIGVKYRWTAHVLDPIYPKADLNYKKNTDYLQEATMRAMIDKYRECFHVDRDNIYDVDPAYYDNLDKDTRLAMSIGRDGKIVDFRESTPQDVCSNNGNE